VETRRAQGSFEYILLLSGVLLVVITITYMMQGSLAQADNTLDAQLKAAGIALDPSYYVPGAKPQFLPSTPADGSGSTTRPNISAAITVKDATLTELKYNWNGTNYTMYDQSLLFGLNMENIPSIGDSAQQVTDISQRGINGRIYANTLLLSHLDTGAGGKTSNNGTCYNMNGASGASECNWVAGKSGSAIQFDGSNDYVDYGNALSLGKTTMTLWFKSSSAKQHNGIIYFVPGNSRGHFEFNYDGTGQPILYLAKNNYAYFNSTASAYFDGKWHFLALYIHGAATADLNSATLSIDLKNISMTSIRVTAAPLAWTGLNIGKSYYGGFDGAVDEIAVYNRALSAAELQRLYSAGAANNTNTDPDAKWGSALNFDGVNDYVSVPDRPEWDFGYNNFSISFWFKKHGATRQYALSMGSSSNNLMFEFNDAGYGAYVYWMGGGTNNVRTTSQYNDSKWHHLTLARNSSAFTLYVDGKNRTTAGYSSNIQINGPTYIGMLGSNYWWNGSIDEIRIWNRTLAPAEVEMHYRSNLYKYTPNVWFFDYRNESLATGTYNYTLYSSGGYRKDSASDTRTVKVCSNPVLC